MKINRERIYPLHEIEIYRIRIFLQIQILAP